MRFLCVILAAALAHTAAAQKAALRPARTYVMPAAADCNSPAHWRDGRLYLFNSVGAPMLSSGADQFQLGAAEPTPVDVNFWVWLESTWQDPSDGTVYGWYHNEPTGLCGGALTVPRIGAVVSHDNGASFHNLGFILESGDPVNCSAANGFFAGGHGDFSVLLDREGKFFYFLFGNYGGEGQGVAIARMAFEDRADPAGHVWKYYSGAWTEPGVGGRVTPVFPAVVGWEQPDTDSFWGPSIHWNTYLERYVVLLNRSCCRPKWPGEGIYVSFNASLDQPEQWSKPERIMAKPPDYYPQVMGLEPDGTDKLAGQVARFYIHGSSKWEIVFFWPESASPPAAAPEPAEAAGAAAKGAPFYLLGSPVPYPLTTIVTPEKSGSVQASPASADSYYPPGATVQLTASPAAGFRFEGWSGDLSGSENPARITLGEPHSVTARFVQARPALSLALTRTGELIRGQAPAAYSIAVSNAMGADATAGPVTVTVNAPRDLRLVSVSGAGWNCSGSVCKREDALAGGASYPPIQVDAGLEAETASPVAMRVSASGGGSREASASDSAAICALAAMESPADGAVLEGRSADFRWSAGTGVAAYRLSIGRDDPGDLYAGVIQGASFTFTNLPADGREIRVRLESNIGGQWYPRDYSYASAAAK